jgi:hypothetical protein
VHWRSDFTASVELGEKVAKHFLSTTMCALTTKRSHSHGPR